MGVSVGSGMAKIPVIEAGGLRARDPAERSRTVQQLGAACRDIGFFYLSDPQFDDARMAKVFGAARAFFALPVERKQALSIKRSPHNRGYVELRGERLQAGVAPDLKEAFNIGLDLPADHPDVVAGKAFRGVNLWPDLPGWRAAMLAYYDMCWELGRLLHRGFALDLGVPETFFEDKLDAPMATLRLLHYPGQPARGAGDTVGAGEHTDYGNVTILATDGVAGLEVRDRTGTWIDAPHIPGAVVCNIGDCLMRWTNDVYVSTPHRVRIPERERFSIAFFLDPNPDAVVAAIPTCVTDAPKYPPVMGADYLAQRLDATYDHRRAAAS